jgi:microcystin-dependent protein
MPKLLDSSAATVGEVKPWSGATAQDGWLLLSGLTISDAGNGGTALASAYARDLFVFLWNNYSNTELPIQNNAGAPVARGANALADFTTNDRRIPLPDLRGRQWVGKDNMGGVAANRVTSGNSGITGTTLGAVGGDERLHAHGHAVKNAQGGTTEPQNGSAQGFAALNTATAGYTTNAAAAALPYIQAGGSGGSQNMPPSFVGTYVIKY